MNLALVVVLDTNVWISGLHFARPGSAATKAVNLALEQHILATCDETELELTRVLKDKFSWSDARCEAILTQIQERSIRVKLRNDVHICRDPKDNMFLECAALAGADLLVAGDDDLLVLGSYGGAKIIKPADYIALHSGTAT